MRGKASRKTIFGFVGPAVIALAVIGIAPLLYAAWTSLHFFNLTRLRQLRFVGLENYGTVLTDPVFWQAMGRTFFLLVTSLPLQIALGLGIALVLHQPGLSLVKTLCRLSLVLPMATTYAVVGLLGQVMFNQRFGVVNQLMGGADINWIGDPTNAFIMIVFWDVWQWTPFVALVLLAGLSMVPGEIEEAAKLETKKWFTILRYVQLPFLIPGLVAVLILRTADTLKLFDMVFTLTRGGPGASTEFISLMIQRVGFRAFDQGLASAQAIILLIITIILAQIYIRVFYKEV
ncbi:MAG: sugar ABC transporter permease [Roseitalea sp.]|jgi:multiple sugar transport system permease protein|uniref:Sugar ABC transporter permease n=1 Tax=Oceaniradius stylonematis TaxID=2184161 RepID=A0A3A8ALX9_9HYPH|nr:sugar ABC transporter permease [Oceaniradius stylonematis]MBO6552103.1 sugar ABC transporter permease [Roseitalea sp.]MBO6951517.1 sugar ABC transporter permease [Rhizobiaceae bacterium]MCR9194654.1 sugar ABC transporter permease [Hyphomonas sp.]RNC96009.1 MAG: sugar ABC transporter permease [Oricola sp.]MBO6592637.1 sugar ABC transporter permease [Roseitalea sp.]